jgi:hypothetical protein
MDLRNVDHAILTNQGKASAKAFRHLHVGHSGRKSSCLLILIMRRTTRAWVARHSDWQSQSPG